MVPGSLAISADSHWSDGSRKVLDIHLKEKETNHWQFTLLAGNTRPATSLFVQNYSCICATGLNITGRFSDH